MIVDGIVTCDRCGATLDGYGVLYGAVCTDIDTAGAQVDRIFCYQVGCRDIAFDGLVTVPPQLNPPVCSVCQVTLAAWATSEAMLAADINPDDGATVRQLAFCYVNGHRDLVLTQARI